MRTTPVRELSEQTAVRLRGMIREKQMRPGDRFPSERELIEQFGVGRSTIREAIKVLVAENLLEIRRGTGTFISQTMGIAKDPLGLQFTPEKTLLQNLFEARFIIEPQIAALAARRATPEDLDRLERALIQHLSCEDESRHAALDVEFHTALARCCHNDVLQRFLPVVIEAIAEGRSQTAAVPGTWDNAKAWHREIFLSVQRGADKDAQEQMLKHLMQTAKEANITHLGGQDL